MNNSIPELDTLLVHVTEDDIRRGRKNDCCFCAVALAIKRLLPNSFGSVGVHTVSIRQVGAWPSYYRAVGLPPEVTRFIRSFDSIHQRNIRPISFELSLC